MRLPHVLISVNMFPMDECCAPIMESPISADEATTLAKRLSTLADPARLQIISRIAAAGEVCACDLEEPLGLSQPTVSHHLKVLVEAGFLEREKRGRWAWYRLVPRALDQVVSLLAVPAG